VLIESLQERYPDRPVIFVIGVLGDKDYASMVRAIVGYAPTRMVICIEPPNPRALSTEELSRALHDELAAQNAQMARAHLFTRPKHEVMIREAKSIPDGVEAAYRIACDLSESRLVRDSKADPFSWLSGWSNAPTYANPVVVACGSLYSVADVTRAYRDVVARVSAE
jgi:folylpolyglutamate synthase/dihydropteroate synthase